MTAEIKVPVSTRPTTRLAVWTGSGLPWRWACVAAVCCPAGCERALGPQWGSNAPGVGRGRHVTGWRALVSWGRSSAVQKVGGRGWRQEGAPSLSEGGLAGAVQSQNRASQEIPWVFIICSLSRPAVFKLCSLLLPRSCTYYVQMSFFNAAFTVIRCCSVTSASLWPRGRQHTRLPCPSLPSRGCSVSCASSQWCCRLKGKHLHTLRTNLTCWRSLCSFGHRLHSRQGRSWLKASFPPVDFKACLSYSSTLSISHLCFQ